MKRNIVIVLAVAIAATAGISLIKVRQWQANAAKIESETLRELSAEDLTEITKSEATASRLAISEMQNSKEKRQAFIKGMREHLALAAQARLDGMADDENYKINVAFKKDKMIADLYQFKLSEGLGRLHVVPKDELNTVWKNKDNELEFSKLMSVLNGIRKEDNVAKGESADIPELKGEMLEKARDNFARTKLLAARAKADKQFVNSNAIQKRFEIVEAGVLSADYLRKHYAANIRPTDAEIRAFKEKHPEYSLARKQKLAEKLQADVNDGANLAELAKKYSEDRGSKAGGGVYEDVRPGALWKEVEAAAKEMKPGEISKSLIKSHLGFHIVELISKKGDPESADFRFSVRHLVIQYKFEEPGGEVNGIPRPFLTAEEIARGEILKQKRDAFVASVVANNPIVLPEDFKIELPEVKPVVKKDQTDGETKKNS